MKTFWHPMDVTQKHFSLVFGKKKVQGMTLLASLVLLLAITVIGTSAINGVTLNNKLVSSTKDYYIALNHAEDALKASAHSFSNPDEPPECDFAQGYLDARQSGTWWQNFDWENEAKEIVFSHEGTEQNSYITVEPPLAGAAPYTSDSLSHDNNVVYNYYRVTTQGQGPNQSKVYIQGIFVMKQQKNVSC
jgi:Tfp pilus assembly protein PilX